MEYGSALNSTVLHSDPPSGSFGYWVGASPPHQGGKEGMSVLSVRRPGFFSGIDSTGPQTSSASTTEGAALAVAVAVVGLGAPAVTVGDVAPVVGALVALVVGPDVAGRLVAAPVGRV